MLGLKTRTFMGRYSTDQISKSPQLTAKLLDAVGKGHTGACKRFGNWLMAWGDDEKTVSYLLEGKKIARSIQWVKNNPGDSDRIFACIDELRSRVALDAVGLFRQCGDKEIWLSVGRYDNATLKVTYPRTNGVKASYTETGTRQDMWDRMFTFINN